MARKYTSSKRGQMVTIHGFTEMAEMLQQLEKRGVDDATGKVFDECCDIIETAVDTYAQQSLPADLAAKKTRFKVKRGNVFMFSYGWDRNANLADFLKVCYLNFGTPKRQTKEGYNRGEIKARGFLSNAKRSAAQKINAKKKNMLKEILGGGSK